MIKLFCDGCNNEMDDRTPVIKSTVQIGKNTVGISVRTINPNSLNATNIGNGGSDLCSECFPKAVSLAIAQATEGGK